MFGRWARKTRLYVKKCPAGLSKLHSTCPTNQIKKLRVFWKNHNFFVFFAFWSKFFSANCREKSSGVVKISFYMSRGNFCRKFCPFWKIGVFILQFQTVIEKELAFWFYKIGVVVEAKFEVPIGPFEQNELLEVCSSGWNSELNFFNILSTKLRRGFQGCILRVQRNNLNTIKDFEKK